VNRRLHFATVIWTKDLAFVWKGAIVTVGLMIPRFFVAEHPVSYNFATLWVFIALTSSRFVAV